MPSLKFYRKRIASVNNTKKITRAMKLVSAAKLRRAQQAAMDHRDYADRLRDLLSQIASRVEGVSNPLLQVREGTKTLHVLITSDRGLCGGFNTNISRKLDQWVVQNGAQCEKVDIRYVGRKGQDYFRVRKVSAGELKGEILHPLDPTVPEKLAKELGDLYTSGQFDRIFLVYNKFISALSQQVTFDPLFPVATGASKDAGPAFDFIYEPSRDDLIARLVPAYLSSRVEQALYESVASEHGARMTAMDSATNNASDMISRLTLYYNRARQAAITKELMEIIGGAEALKG